jgi:TFIIF-interacting CTD phosphatase-like protein
MQTLETEEGQPEIDLDSTIDKATLKTREKDSAAKSEKKFSSAKKRLNESHDKTLEHTAKSKALEVSASKKGFLEFLQRLEKAADIEDRSLFHFQPILNQVEERPQGPFLPPMDAKSGVKYTLVLDLDETLVHFEENDERSGGQFHIRPFAEEFLQMLSPHYELVIFTAAIKEVLSSY